MYCIKCKKLKSKDIKFRIWDSTLLISTSCAVFVNNNAKNYKEKSLIEILKILVITNNT